MKKIFLFILFFSFIARPIYYVGQYTYYALNLDFIIENYCINKNRPELNCDGKCYLAKQIQLAEDKVEDDALQEVVGAFFPVFKVNETDYSIVDHFTRPSSLLIYSYENAYTFLGVNKTFRPPIVYFF